MLKWLSRFTADTSITESALVINSSMKLMLVNMSNKKEGLFWQNFGKISSENKKGRAMFTLTP
jgi:hypothetical protein